MKPEWKDETSYSRNNPERVPRIWEMQLDYDYKLVVHRLMGIRDEWFCSLRGPGGPHLFSDHELEAADLKKAKKEAIALAHGFLNQLSINVLQVAKTLWELL